MILLVLYNALRYFVYTLPHFCYKDDEDNILDVIRDSLVLVERDSFNWNWTLIDTILKTNSNVLRRIDSYTLNRYLLGAST